MLGRLASDRRKLRWNCSSSAAVDFDSKRGMRGGSVSCSSCVKQSRERCHDALEKGSGRGCKKGCGIGRNLELNVDLGKSCLTGASRSLGITGGACPIGELRLRRVACFGATGGGGSKKNRGSIGCGEEGSGDCSSIAMSKIRMSEEGR